jgi:hypothetical protein
MPTTSQKTGNAIEFFLAMGTDFLQLFDKRTAQLVIEGNESDLVTLVDFRTRREGASIWQSYWSGGEERIIDFEPRTPNSARLGIQLAHGTTLEEIKEDLLRRLCTMQAMFYLDYWGCSAEVFITGPPGAQTWEQFVAPIRKSHVEPNGSSGCYLLTQENVDAILRGLRSHQDELQIMTLADIERLASWQQFCAKDPGFCILYQMDF